jgi:TRAP transporter TAXI family solute receptor
MASAGDSVTVLNVTDEELARLDGGAELWTRYTIPAGTYPGQDPDINTIAQPNFLGVSADVPEEHVYQITKTVYENLPFLQAIHPATKACRWRPRWPACRPAASRRGALLRGSRRHGARPPEALTS